MLRCFVCSWRTTLPNLAFYLFFNQGAKKLKPKCSGSCRNQLVLLYVGNCGASFSLKTILRIAPLILSSSFIRCAYEKEARRLWTSRHQVFLFTLCFYFIINGSIHRKRGCSTLRSENLKVLLRLLSPLGFSVPLCVREVPVCERVWTYSRGSANMPKGAGKSRGAINFNKVNLNDPDDVDGDPRFMYSSVLFAWPTTRLGWWYRFVFWAPDQLHCLFGGVFSYFVRLTN